MGSVEEDYSVQQEAAKILRQGILSNPLIPSLPPEIKEAAELVHFTGKPLPSIPINWRFAESVSALKAFEASMLNVLRAKKYGAPLSEVTIDTDHASLFIMTLVLPKSVQHDGSLLEMSVFKGRNLEKAGFKNQDTYKAKPSLQRSLTTNIYRTKDGRDYHVHGSMNPEPSLTALGLPFDGEKGDTFDIVVDRFQQTVGKWDSGELDEVMNEQYKQAGTIAWSIDEFKASEHGKANCHASLYELNKVEGSSQPASWWPENPSMPSSAERPLAGLKVVDLTRVIAAPTITRSLAEMGASVMRVTSPNVTDIWVLHQDLNWGKWTCHLDLKKNPEDRQKLIELIKEADVVVEGYRPGSMARNGFGRDDILEMVKGRDRGIIHVRENCYGWHGPWMHRTGWQQISDAVTGVSLAYGRAMGVDEAVTPVFPNSDCCTGIAGSVGILHALIRRGQEGGSYAVDCSLNYYSQWLVNSVGTYPQDIWMDVWKRHGSPVFRNYHFMAYTIPDLIKRLEEHDGEEFFNPDFLERRKSGAMGREFIQLKPVAKFKDGVRLGFNVGCRSNGADAPRWPEDLTVEIVK